MKKILLSLGLIMMNALAFTPTPVNAEEPCTHDLQSENMCVKIVKLQFIKK